MPALVNTPAESATRPEFVQAAVTVNTAELLTNTVPLLTRVLVTVNDVPAPSRSTVPLLTRLVLVPNTLPPLSRNVPWFVTSVSIGLNKTPGPPSSTLARLLVMGLGEP